MQHSSALRVIPAGPFIAAGQSLEVTVPGTSANLGPGFDTLGLAVTLRDTVRVRAVESGTTTVTALGESAGTLPRDERHLVAKSLLATLHRAGRRSPGLEIDTVNVLPHGRGLGSSAAAIVSGAVAANALLADEDRMDEKALLQWCATLEGHPDNVASALSGSLAISWESGKAYFSTRLEVHPDVIPVAAVPGTSLSTDSARALLPTSVSHWSAATNAGRAALLVHALSARPDLLLPATEDFLHQDYRAPAMVASAMLVRALRTAGFAAVISGAGPTVMTLAVGEKQAAEAVIAARTLLDASDTPDSWRVLRLDVDREGAKLGVHPG
ncbi:homoserine kinase [Arthrobacter sp. Br18]|uniref:homoserine kinase n=1 Tax=Arthrobacter sp. Br18 TaxID=1312954 RepID=UPI0004B699BF|nr:homoserine kinase [Arthrobacter sp. Br18]